MYVLRVSGKYNIIIVFFRRMSIQSALIGFLISKMLPNPLSPQEIVVVQTTAVAMGAMPVGAGFIGILPALTLLSEDRDGSPPIHLTWLAAVGWSCSVAFFGSAQRLSPLFKC
jgi:uncharacterized oligopeptide transporter (OPT) family protein